MQFVSSRREARNDSRNYSGKQPTLSIVWLLTLTIFLLLPETWLTDTNPWYRPIVSIGFGCYDYLAIVLSVLMLGSYIETKCNRWLGRIICIAFGMFAVAYSVSQSFLWFHFYRRWDLFTMQLVSETNANESSEFLVTYVLSPTTLLILLAYSLAIGISVLADRKIRRRQMPRKVWQKVLLGLYILSVYAQVYFLTGSLNDNYERAAGWPVKCTAIFNIRQSMLQRQEYGGEINRCIKTLQDYSYQDSIPTDAPDVVWIIGESYSRHHSALYGYNLMTTPYSCRRMESGHLFRFDDVIAPDNGTSNCFKAFMSMASSDSKLKWCDAPMLPALFRNKGWNVVFYSNQFTSTDDLGQWDASMGFMNHPKISDRMFSSRNNKTFPYDMQLVEHYKQNRNRLEQKHHNFIIFHLIGQHVRFNSRYPENQAKFHANDIKRTDCTDQQREMIAHYDNATLYDDAVVESIVQMFENRDAVIVFFPDHAEEVYDFRNQMGRTALDKDDSRALRQQLDIPFFVIPTTRCITSHPDIPTRLRSAQRLPFMTDDFPHFLLDLLQVKSPSLDLTRSPLSKKYVVRKRLIVNASRYYDEE